MKSTDLMVGDWVVSPMGHPYKAYELTQEFAYFDNSEGELSDILPKVGIKYDALVPIPLTAEILEANGWWVDDYDETRYHLGNDGTLEIEEWQSGLQSYDIPAMKFRFVHELQHALRLCGLNDLADNFKLA